VSGLRRLSSAPCDPQTHMRKSAAVNKNYGA
jgi:hypothetical protein